MNLQEHKDQFEQGLKNLVQEFYMNTGVEVCGTITTTPYSKRFKAAFVDVEVKYKEDEIKVTPENN